LHTGAEHYKKVMCCLRRHMVGPDLHAWQLVLASVDEMSTELKVLANSGASTGITYQLQTPNTTPTPASTPNPQSPDPDLNPNLNPTSSPAPTPYPPP